MKPTAYLVNTARGGVVDKAALQAARSRAPGLDAFSEEPRTPDQPLFELDNVITTPHTGGITAESMERMGMTAAEGMVSVLAGRRPQYLVTKKPGGTETQAARGGRDGAWW